MARFASIDIGTNSVLLLVAERNPDGTFSPLVERAEITRLGRGVDQTRTLSAEGMEATLACLESFAGEARSLGAQQIAVSATSAARDAKNGADFIHAAKTRAAVEPEIISGDLEAQLSFAAARADFERELAGAPLVVLDIGGGSTEVIYGNRQGAIDFRHSFDVGSVRLTERFVTQHPIPGAERALIARTLRDAFAPLPKPPAGAVLIGLAGTITTLFAVHNAIDPYDVSKVQGGTLTRKEVRGLVTRLCDLSLEARTRLPGLQPKRADVICAGALILQTAMDQLGVDGCRVSDRGLRWGLLTHKFGGR